MRQFYRELMDALGADSFAPTQRNAALRKGNTNPRRAYPQQAAVELSAQGLSWLGERLQASFDVHGEVPRLGSWATRGELSEDRGSGVEAARRANGRVHE